MVEVPPQSPPCCPRCGAVTSDSDDTHRCDLAAPPGEPLRRVRVGEVLEGRWKLVKQIGHGASGTVFLAHDTTLRRKVAVKVLSPEQCGNPRSLARFEREAAVMASLAHPNLVALHAVGRAGGAPFIVMKHLEGVNLAEHRHGSGGRLTPAQALPIVRQLCAGLGHLHANGLVHRDVKPGNVIVGAAGEVTLLDLGVARDPGVPSVTQPGVVVGTPRYMAPEQLMGETGVDCRADLYSLAVVTFELLAGAPPESAAAGPPGAAPALAALFARGLAKTASERFGSAGELLAAFERACAGASTPESTLVDEDEEDDGEKEADRPSTSLAPLDTLDTPDSDGVTGGSQQPGATLMLPDSEERLADPPGATGLGRGFGTLSIVATLYGAPTQASVTVDGLPRGASPLVLAVLPGQHLVRAERVGFGAAERCVDVRAAGAQTVVEVEVKSTRKR